ncbi:MAG: PKD domain-containing protein, partial [Acidimicrobiia bacterium]
STRPRGNVAVPWTPPTWDQNDEVGPDQQTADLKFLIQEVVQRPGWAGGNAIALIITGSGTRIANAIEGGFASHLHVVYSTGGPPPNQPPLANAGPDQQVTMALPATATLDGSGSTDDTGITSFAWSQLSGPGTATITNTDQEVSDVSLPEFGTYTFQLMVTDGGGLTDTDEVVITVLDPSGPQTLETPVAVGADDAEEKPTGRVTLTNGDLDLVLDSSTNMTTALRFTGVNIPAGAIITNAYIQFRSDEIQADTANLVIQGHDVANAPAFTTVKFNITGRARTTAGVAWSPDPWTGNRLTGLAQRTPDLKSIVSELTAAGSGWTSGNAMVFIISGSGKRTADSFEGGFASRLVIEYSVP